MTAERVVIDDIDFLFEDNQTCDECGAELVSDRSIVSVDTKNGKSEKLCSNCMQASRAKHLSELAESDVDLL